MRSKARKLLGSLVIVIVYCNYLTAQTAFLSHSVIAMKSHMIAPDQNHWTIANLSKVLSTMHANEFIFMEESSMTGTYIEVNSGDSFHYKTTHDAIYYIYSGNGTFQHSNSQQALQEGEVLFVKKGSDISIDHILKKIQIVRVHMKLDSQVKNHEPEHYTVSLIEAERSSSHNTWNPFLRHSNVMLGLYMLPLKYGGDSRLVHEWQELNIVTSGSSQFVMDTETINVEKGSIFFVDKANGHYFDSLEDDIDILILWEQTNVEHDDH